MATDTNTSTEKATSKDLHVLRLKEMGAICDSLATYSTDDWDHDTYCEGWRVRDVIGHMLVGYTTPMPTMIAKVAKRGFSVPKASAIESAAYGSAHTPGELLAEYRRIQRDDVRMGIAKLIPPSEAVVDHVIHHLDITRPLGRPTTTTPELRRAALDKIVTLGGFVKGKGRAKGLSFAATDMDWSWGEGPLVSGPSEDLLLALSGRPVGLDALTGDGVATLRERVAG